LENNNLMENTGFLQSVICNAAELLYEAEIIDTNSEDEIGEGETWETKKDWMNEKITQLFKDTAKKIKTFPDKSSNEFNIKSMPVDFAKSIYGLSLGESFTTDDDIIIIRVPGGWIYILNCAEGQNSVFIPYNNEFLKLTSSKILNNDGF